MSLKDEALERGRELYVEIFSSQFSNQVLSVLEGSEIDDILFAIFHDSINEGFLTDITGGLDKEHYEDGTPLYAITAMRLRTLMCASLTVGMWHQKVTNILDSMWEVDKTST